MDERGHHSSPIPHDKAQAFLSSHLRETQQLLLESLRSLDPNAECQIRYAADLGIPWDVLRLAGGFATGCVVDWKCNIPIVPVDTTMNVDLTSVFELSSAPTRGLFALTEMHRIRTTIENNSSFSWNFESGNHFISLCRDGKNWILVLHSNDREFKGQYNGLYPATENWYARNLRTLGHPTRPIRILTGSAAKLFNDTSQMLRSYNRVRHEMIAECVLNGSAVVASVHHKEHYFMPTSSTACLGAYLSAPQERVVVFSEPGAPLAIFEPHGGGPNQIHLLSGGEALIVPHGWGVGLTTSNIEVTWPEVAIDGRRHQVDLGHSFFGDQAVAPRSFKSQQDFFGTISADVPGRIVREVEQVESCSRAGIQRHPAGLDETSLKPQTLEVPR